MEKVMCYVCHGLCRLKKWLGRESWRGIIRKTHYYCPKCARCIPKEEAVKDNGNGLRCPCCKIKLRTRPNEYKGKERIRREKRRMDI